MNIVMLGTIIGIFAGGAAVGIIAGIMFINARLNSLVNALQVLTAKIIKIEKVTEATMMASENFVDALQASVESMGFGPPRKRYGKQTGKPDDFGDLRETFEDGIRNLEEDSDEEDENWQKGA
jgi:hypothetical protein